MPSTCVFEFDRPQPIYFSGETVKVVVKLNTTSVKAIRHVYIEFIGEAKVAWKERRGKTTYRYRANEIYLNQRTIFTTGDSLPIGLHTYTLEIPLPISCPTSCTEKYGHITYELALVIDRPLRFDNKFIRPFTVIKQLDLNLSPVYALPLSAEEIKYLCCWCCSSGPIIATATIPFGGYVPGQKIKYKLELDNQSPKYDLNGFKLQLLQEYQFVAQSPYNKTRIHDNIVAIAERNMECLRLTKRVIEGELIVPSGPPSSLGYGIISISYKIKMIIDCGRCHRNVEVIIPITIGTVPIIQSATDPSHVSWLQPMQPPSAPNMTPDIPDSDKLPNYELYKPPSFEESKSHSKIFVDKDRDEHNRVAGFIPKYPMYTNFSEPTAPPTSDEIPSTSDAACEPLITSNLETTRSIPSSSFTTTPNPLELLPAGGSSDLPYPMNQDTQAPIQPFATSTRGYGWA